VNEQPKSKHFRGDWNADAITLWQTHSWIKKIVKLRKRSETREEAQAMRQRGK
jgi:hypothetical protein